MYVFLKHFHSNILLDTQFDNKTSCFLKMYWDQWLKILNYLFIV